MKKLLSLAVFATIGLTGCGADATTAIATFATNLESAETVEISYQSAGDDFTLNAGDEVAFSDLETLTSFNWANENDDDVLSYDEALAAVSTELEVLPSDMGQYTNKVKKADGNVVVEFETEGISEDASGLDSYAFAEDGMSATFSSEFTYGSGDTSSSMVTVTLS